MVPVLRFAGFNMIKIIKTRSVPKNLTAFIPLLLHILVGFIIGIFFMLIYFPSKSEILPVSRKSVINLLEFVGKKPQLYDDYVRKLNNFTNPGTSEATSGSVINFNSYGENGPRIFCWILTHPGNIKRAEAVKGTWLKRCDGFVFVSSVDDLNLPAVDAGLGENRTVLWGKTKFAFKYLYENFLDDYDWFLKADDDTYVVMDNLRYFLRNQSISDPVYFGSLFQMYMEQGYMSGGAGYVLSREALRRFAEQGLGEDKCSHKITGNEDVELGRCMEKIGVKTGDSRDELGQGRFFPQQVTFHLKPDHMNKSFWYGRFAKYDEKDYMECCSDSAISFHYVKDMYMYEYLIYHLKPHDWKTGKEITAI